MKKIIVVLLLAVVLPLSASAYSPYGGYGYRDVTVDVTARGGYNFMENKPLVSGVVGLDFLGVRAELELGWTNVNLPFSSNKKNFCYISPMIGYSYGFNHNVYAMIGITNWGYAELYDTSEQGYDWQHKICGKIKVGANMYLNQHLFVNLDLSYLLPTYSRYSSIDYQSFNLCVGIGYRF